MNPSLVPAECLELAARGRWRDAWSALPRSSTAAWRQAAIDELAWLHELCLRLGRDQQRRAIARAAQRQHGGRLATRTLQVQEHLRTGALIEAWHASRDDVPTARDDREELHWLLARARLHSDLHDHTTATACLTQARARAADTAAVEIETAWSLQDADRLDDALATCRRAVQRWPDDPLPRLQLAWLLYDVNAPDAGAMLASVCATLQSPPLEAILATLQHERGNLAAARASFDALLAQSCHERRPRIAWRFALARICREQGDDRAALAALEAAGRQGEAAAAKLRAHLDAPSPADRRRVVLPVPFVRQDHMTCSPATMAALLQTFGTVVDQREIAAQITYDGTASHDELVWAESRGLVVRWFEFAPATARDLLDRGLPFAVTTRFETSGHRQAVVGYDGVFDTFVLRDPTGNFRREVPTEWLSHLTARGGQCALLLPADVATAQPIPGLPLEAEARTWLQVQIDWREHRLAAAEAKLATLVALPPGPLRHEIETRTARHRGDRRRELELWRTAHAAAPDDPYWQYHLATELLDQNRWHEARSSIEQWAARSRSPYLQRLLADQLRTDARRRPEALVLLRRALRRLGRDARAWRDYGSLLQVLGDRDAGVEVHRLATTMAPQDEYLAAQYFWALHDRGQSETGLAFLRERCERLGARSAAAASTLAESLETLHDPDAAVAVLRAALARHDDRGVRQHLFDLLLRLHRLDEAEPLLAAAGWLPLARALSRHALAARRGDHTTALAALDECIAIDPWHTGAQRMRLSHLLEHAGEAAAVAAADTLVAAHGDQPPLMVTVVEFYHRIEDRGRERALLQRLVEQHPHELWLRGRLVRHLLLTGDVAAARPLLAGLQQAMPDASVVWVDVATAAHADGDLAAARTAARRAFELDPDNAVALQRLVDWAPDREQAMAEVRAAMQFVAARPLPPSNELLDVLGTAAAAVPADEYRSFLQRLEQAFPANPVPTVARCHFEGQHDPEAALALATTLVARQPWSTAHRLREAACHRAAGQPERERAALERLIELAPSCAQAYADLGEALEREGRLSQAIAVYERGIANVPGHAVLHGMVADTAWRLGDRDRALAAAARAATIDRGYAWAFEAQANWRLELGQPAAALQVVEQLVAASPRWATAHELHAGVLARLGRHDERIAALRRGLALTPRLGPARLQLVDALIELKQFDAARTVIAEGLTLHGDEPSLLLRQAQIDRTAGDYASARERLRGLLERHPGFTSGWTRYLQWCDEEGRTTEILQLYRQPPPALRDRPVLFGYAADAFRGRGDPQAAMQALERALELDPGYEWARDTLCALALERGDPGRVLTLLPDHTEPAALPFRRAVLVAKAAARRRDRALLSRVGARLLQDPDADGQLLREVDALHRALDAEGSERLLREAAAAPAPEPAARNRLRVLAGRGRWPEFFADLSSLQAAVGGPRGDAVTAELLADAQRLAPWTDLVDWVARHVHPPVAETAAMGHLLYALPTSKVAGASQAVRLFGADWRRPDVRGWMLANLAAALHRLRRRDQLIEVCRHALEHVAHDHSTWWHRRYLAEAALEEGRLDDARALCRMPVDDFHDVRLAVHQIDLVAELRQTPFRDRGAVVRRRWTELWRRFDAAAAEGGADLASLRAGELVRLWPAPRTLLLLAGRFGRALARRL